MIMFMNRILFLFLVTTTFPALIYANDTIVARVNNALITAAELESAVDRLIPRASYHGSVSSEKRNELREKALEGLIDKELQYQDAVQRGMKPEKKQVKAQMAQIRDRFKTKKEYKTALEQAQMTEDQLEAQVSREVLIQNVISKIVVERAHMSDEALKEYYDKNTSKFKRPESVRLRLMSSKDEKKATDMLSKVKAGGDFETLATTMSEDDYRVKGGDIGYQHKGKLLPGIEQAAFSMKTGEVSGLIKEEGLWFIIKVEDRRPEYQMTFDEAKDKLKKELEKKRTDELMSTWVAELRSKAKIEVVQESDAQRTDKHKNDVP